MGWNINLRALCLLKQKIILLPYQKYLKLIQSFSDTSSESFISTYFISTYSKKLDWKLGLVSYYQKL